MSTPPPSKPDEAARLEQQTLAFLAGGKFRKAREEAKLLRKLDPSKALPLLIRANVGLARDMMAKGQVSEAQQVLAYLATIAPPAELRAIGTEMAGHTGDFAATAQAAFRLLAESAASLPEAERWRTVDLVVLAFDEPTATNPAAASLAAELRAIHTAFRALAERQWTAAQDALRPVPQRSVFSHWKLFLKGLVAFHQGDAARAERCLSELPPGTVPAKAAEPYLLLLNTRGGRAAAKAPSERTLEGLCHLLGRGGLGRTLARAEQLWRQRKAGESYRFVRENLGGFPSEQPDLIGALTDFYCNSLFAAPEPVREDLAECFDQMLSRRRPGDALERALMFRAMGLFQQGEADAYSLRVDWNGFLEAYEQVHGRNPRLASLTLAFLGEQLTRPAPSWGFPLFPRHRQMLDPDGAVDVLQRSVALDPKNLEAAVQLCDLYEALRRTSEHHRLLDDMVERFPENKGVLLRAGRRCVDRKAFTKGLGYLGRARELDLLDPTLARESVRALFGLAGEQFKKQRPEAARASLDQVQTFAVDQPSNLVCARWCLLARRAATEEALGDPARVDSLAAEAQTLCPSQEAFLLYAHLALLDSQRVTYDQPTRFSREFLGAPLKSASAARALPLIRIHEFWAGSEDDRRSSGGGTLLVQRYLLAAQKAPFTADEVRGLTEHSGPQNRFAHEVAGFVRRILARDRNHPWSRLYQLTSPMFGLDGGPKEQRELRAIVEEANRRGDSETAQRAKQLLDRRTVPPPLPPPLPPPPESWEDEDEDDFESGAKRDIERGFGGAPAEVDDDFDTTDHRMVEDLAREMALLPEGQLRRLRKQMVKKGLPGFLFDLLVDAARRGGPLPNLPPIPKPPTRTPRPPDPNQLDLF